MREPIEVAKGEKWTSSIVLTVAVKDLDARQLIMCLSRM